MHVDCYIALAGGIVGFAVGLTGMGGGALMTPVLVLVFGIQPLAAVSSDLVASVVMKPIGSLVHLRRRTAELQLVGWLCAGSVPAAFGGAVLLRMLGHGRAVAADIKVALGVALLVAVGGIIVRAWVERGRDQVSGEETVAMITIRPVLTVAVGAVGGLIVGMTSVGSGSLMIVALMFLYPRLSGRRLVGTDLVQSVPLVASAALGHLLFGDVHLGLTVSLLLGAVPGVYLGARISARTSTPWLRPAIAVVLLATGLKLIQVDNTTLAAAIGGTVVVVVATALARRVGASAPPVADTAAPR